MIRRPPRTTRTDTLSLHDALPICVGWRVDRVPRMGMERAGVTFASLMGLGPQTAVDTAKLAEEVGYSSFWTAETTGPEAFSVLAAAGAAAPSLDLGTGVLALQLRTPMVVALAGATLQALPPDREILLGVGISSPVLASRWHGQPYTHRSEEHTS